MGFCLGIHGGFARHCCRARDQVTANARETPQGKRIFACRALEMNIVQLLNGFRSFVIIGALS
jgi:hypothetical protein